MALFRLIALFCSMLMLQGLPSFAQESPLMGSEANQLLPGGQRPVNTTTVLSQDELFRILVIGDALAGGLGAGMTRMAEADPAIEIINRFNEASGLARTAVYDWPGALPKIVANNPVDAVVVLVGVNDRQEIRQGNARYPFKSPEWINGYTEKIDRLAAAVKAANAKLFWISIPPMENAAFDADMRYLSSIHQQRVAAAQGVFVDVRSFFLSADGRYVDRGQDDTGIDRKLRSRDGVTFFKQGNNRFGQLVLGSIKAIALKPDGNATAAVVPSVEPLQDAPAEQAGSLVPPSFGQVGLDGEHLSFRADSVVQATATAADSAGGVVNSGVIRPQAKPGTAAELLFEHGLGGTAPVGRFDDYTEVLP